MAFPVSKQAKIEFELADGQVSNLTLIQTTFFDHLVHAEIDKLKKLDNKIIFTSKNSLFRLSYNISVGFRIEKNLIVEYEIRLSELLKLCVLFAILIAFFSRMQLEYFVTLFVLTITSFYFLNIFILENGLKNMLRGIFEKTPYSPESKHGNEPQNWMDDSSRCPACGEFVREADTKCPSCKLSLPTRKKDHKYYKQYKAGAGQPTIHYDYKEKKK